MQFKVERLILFPKFTLYPNKAGRAFLLSVVPVLHHFFMLGPMFLL